MDTAPVTTSAACVIAIDPGRDKCGLAVVEAAGTLVAHCIVSVPDLPRHVQALCAQWSPRALVLGDRTGHRDIHDAVTDLALGIPLHLVDEHHSTLEARRLYFDSVPRRGWRRLVPLSLQTPPVPIDDYAAAVLARRFLAAEAERADNDATLHKV